MLRIAQMMVVVGVITLTLAVRKRNWFEASSGRLKPPGAKPAANQASTSDSFGQRGRRMVHDPQSVRCRSLQIVA